MALAETSSVSCTSACKAFAECLQEPQRIQCDALLWGKEQTYGAMFTYATRGASRPYGRGHRVEHVSDSEEARRASMTGG